MRLPNEADVPAQINIVPMIDVIFAILTFFCDVNPIFN